MAKGRAKGTGYLFKDPRSGIYQLEYKIGGHRKKTSLGVRRKLDRVREDGTVEKGAETLAAEFLEAGRMERTRREIILDFAEQRGVIGGGMLANGEAFAKFTSIYRSERRVSDDSFINYQRQWGRFVSWLGKYHPDATTLRDVSEDIAREYWSLFKDGAASTANQHLSTLKVIFKTLQKPAGLLFNPWDGIQRRAKDGISREYLAAADIDRLFGTFEFGGTNAHCTDEYQALFQIGRNTGLRLGDCCLLTWSVIDLARNEISLYPHKTKRVNREVIIPIFRPEFRALLDRLPRSSEYVLPQIAAGYRRYKKGVKDEVSAIFQRAGFKTQVLLPGRKMPTCVIGFHCFRGSLATDLLNAGVPASIVSKIIGDDITTLQKHYVKVKSEHIHNAIAKINILDL